MARRIAIAGIGAVCGLLLVSAPAAAEPELYPTFSAKLGAYLISSDTTGSLEAQGGGGEEVNFEDDFGLDDNRNVGTVRLEWQPLEHHMFRFGWYELSNDGGRSASRDINWGGVVYPAGAAISAELTNTVWEVDWTWFWYKRDRGAVGLELGVTALDLEVEASARVQVGSLVEERRRSASTWAPVPTIGVAARGLVGSRLLLSGAVRVLPGVQIDNIDGDALIAGVSGDWMFTDNFGAGLAWTSFAIDAEVDDSRYHGSLELTYSGLQLYARINL